MGPGTDIENIVKGCVKGDKKCQEALHKAFYGKMMVICLRYTSDRDEAKDIVQEGFIKVFNSLPKFDFTGSFDTWMRRIFVNTAIDYYRKNKTLLNIIDSNVEVDNLEEFGEEPGSNFIELKNLQKSDILEAVQKLTPVYRTVFNMYAMDGFNHQQIATELNISLGTSKSNYAKAKNNLQKLLMKKLITCNETY